MDKKPRPNATLDDAIAAYRRELAAGPARYDVLINLAAAVRKKGESDEAFALLSRASSVAPERPEAWFNLGNLARDAGMAEEAIQFYDAAHERCGNDAAILDALSVAFLGLDRPEPALECLRAVLTVRPTDAEMLARMGTTLRRLEEFEDAASYLCEAAEQRPNDIRIRNEYAVALRQLGRNKQALAQCDAALAQAPDDAASHWNRALVLLSSGLLAEGWDEYRWGWAAGKRQPQRPHPQPEWNGEAGGGVLLWGEQGVGDELVFASAIPDAITRAQRVTVECDPRLVPLFARSFPQAAIVPRRDPPDARTRTPELVWQAPLGELPRLFRRQIADFPARPWLRADAEATAHWRKRLAQLPPGRRVGISWRSTLRSSLRRGQYMAVDDLEPVTSLPDIVLVNLQYGDCAAELDNLAAKGRTVHRFADLDLMNDLDDVAALMQALDGVVAPGNAVSALAGALGVRAWRFEVAHADYLRLGTDRMPWFSATECVSRAPQEGWEGVVRTLADRLTTLACAERRP